MNKEQRTSESAAVAVCDPGTFALFAGDVDIAGVSAAMASNLEGESLDAYDLDRIKIPAGGGTTWEIPSIDGVVESKEIVGIVALSKFGRSYWEKTTDESGGGSPPDCVSEDGERGSKFGACDVCPHNVYGSASKGSGKACKELRSIFMIMEGSVLPVVINIPPTSLKPFKQYRLRLTSVGKRIDHVITRITLTKAKNAQGTQYSQAVFSKAGDLTPEQAAMMSAYVESLKPIFAAAHRAGVKSGEAYQAGHGNDDAAGDMPDGKNPFQ